MAAFEFMWAKLDQRIREDIAPLYIQNWPYIRWGGGWGILGGGWGILHGLFPYLRNCSLSTEESISLCMGIIDFVHVHLRLNTYR